MDQTIITFRLPDEMADLLDEYVDGARYRSRAHLVACIVADWLDQDDDDEASADSEDDEPEPGEDDSDFEDEYEAA